MTCALGPGWAWAHPCTQAILFSSNPQKNRRAFAQGVSDPWQCAFDVYLFIFSNKTSTKTAMETTWNNVFATLFIKDLVFVKRRHRNDTLETKWNIIIDIWKGKQATIMQLDGWRRSYTMCSSHSPFLFSSITERETNNNLCNCDCLLSQVSLKHVLIMDPEMLDSTENTETLRHSKK